jgi:predicted nucleic acid-binding protein
LPPLVVDCSVMVAAMFEEPARDQAIALMSGKLLFAPGLLVHEMVNVAVRKLRSGWPAENVQQAIIDFSAHDVE